MCWESGRKITRKEEQIVYSAYAGRQGHCALKKLRPFGLCYCMRTGKISLESVGNFFGTSLLP